MQSASRSDRCLSPASYSVWRDLSIGLKWPLKNRIVRMDTAYGDQMQCSHNMFTAYTHVASFPGNVGCLAWEWGLPLQVGSSTFVTISYNAYHINRILHIHHTVFTEWEFLYSVSWWDVWQHVLHGQGSGEQNAARGTTVWSKQNLCT